MARKAKSASPLPLKRTSLDGAWTLSGSLPSGEAIEIAARVPGVVHWDLERAGIIPNPSLDANEADVQWVALQTWSYKRTFTLTKRAVEADHVELVFDGLDTIAAISLNGEYVGRAENMFVPHRFDVKKLVTAGENEIEVVFSSPVEEGLKLHNEYKSVRLYEGEDNPRAYLRKAQYSFGWDWGPKITTSGIWRSAYIESWNASRIASAFWRTTRADAESARVEIEVECVGASRCEVRATLSRNDASFSVDLERTKVPGGATFSGSLDIENPDLWWPAGQGEQCLYDAEVLLKTDGKTVDRRSCRIGVRTVDLERESDDEGESFVIVVNGREIFCKGANWIPADTYLPRITAKDYDEWVRLAADANMNMLRVWGGGIYESPAFYEACDKRGIMVWQDFPFACAMYPEEKWFLKNVKKEAEAAVRILRNHPSIVIWCGNNENHWAAVSWWPKDPFGGKTVYDKMLPTLLKRLDPSRPYWPGSPYGGKDPNSAEQGDRHAWNVWSGWKDFRDYLADKGRFVSEFGFQGCPEMETVAEFGPLAELQPHTPLFERHNKMIEGPERLARFLAGFFRMPTGLEEFVYLTQVLQGEAIKTGVLHWRSRMMKTAGALYWQLNDCWPVTSWASVDYKRRPKGLYYYTRRFFSPVAARVAKLQDGVSGWVINDSTAKVEGDLLIQCITVDGTEAGALREHVELAPNSVHHAGPYKPDLFGIDDPTRQVLVATFRSSDGTVSRDVGFINRPKHMRLGDPGLDWEISGQNGRFTVTLSAKSLAYAVYLRLPGTKAEFSDNFVTLLPGESIDVEVKGSRLNASQAARRLEVKWVSGGL